MPRYRCSVVRPIKGRKNGVQPVVKGKPGEGKGVMKGKRRSSRFRSWIGVACVSLLVAGSVQAEQVQPLGENYDRIVRVEPALDAVILRPLGVLATITGTALFLVSAPFVALTRPSELKVPFNYLVVRPAR